MSAELGSESPVSTAESSSTKTPTVSLHTPTPGEGSSGLMSNAPEPKITLPESRVAAPEKDTASPMMKYDTVLLARSPDTRTHSGWHYRQNWQNEIVGFEFSNRGGNRILPHRYDSQRNLFFTRDFQFRFDDRARQDIHLHIADWTASQNRGFKLSEIMNSIIYFFPRNYLPAIARSGERIIVTLPTGEKVEFDAATHEVVGGVFSEAPVDLNPNRAARKFPSIHYDGKGVIVRVNARGADPRLGTVATISNGSSASNCAKAIGCKQCQVPAKELWEQKGPVRFKFATDIEFDRYLQSRCGFTLPKESIIVIPPDSPRATG